MKAMAFILILAVSSISLAHGEHGHGGGKWEERKAKKIAKMEERIARITKNRDCLKSATTKEAFQACMKTIRAEHKQWKESKGR